MKKLLIFFLVWISLANAHPGHVTLTGAGATFPYPLYSQWAEAYEKITGVKLNYQSIGSGGGIKQIKAGTVDFGASDKPLPENELRVSGLLQFPTVFGAVVPVVNLPKLISGQLKLTGTLLAQIFLGEIKEWDDPKITAINPQIPLPHLMITVVHRSDASGTTYLFTQYLSKVNSSWAEQIGADTAVAWPVGIGGKGNEAVASYVKRIEGALGYIEFAYAKENKLPLVSLQNQQGQFVEPKLENFQAALDGVHFENLANLSQNISDAAGQNAWPILGATYILMRIQQEDTRKAQALLEFFKWALQDGSSIAVSLDYIPLPEELRRLIFTMWKQTIKDSQGKAIEINF